MVAIGSPRAWPHPLLRGAIRKDLEIPGASLEIRILSRSADQSAGQARTGAVRLLGRLDASGDNSAEKSSRAHNGMVRRGQHQRGVVIISAGSAPRIASALIPGSLAGPGAVRVPAAGAGGVRSVPGTGEIHAVRKAFSRLGPGCPSASPDGT